MSKPDTLSAAIQRYINELNEVVAENEVEITRLSDGTVIKESLLKQGINWVSYKTELVSSTELAKGVVADLSAMLDYYTPKLRGKSHG